MHKSVLLVLILLRALAVSNAQAPSIEWQVCTGGSAEEEHPDVVQTIDGGYVIVANTFSTNGDATGNHGDADLLVKKLDATGNSEWSTVLGGSAWEARNAVRQTSDGGYLVLATTASTDGNVTGMHGGLDLWVVKLDATGTMQWQRCLGGTGNESIHYVDDSWTGILELTDDGGSLIAGTTTSTDGDVTGWHPGYSQGTELNDLWVVKLDANGSIQWQRTLGGSGHELLAQMVLTSDGGSLLVGNTDSADGDVVGWHSGQSVTGANDDLWVVKLSATGAMEWQRTLGGSDGEFAQGVLETPDGGFLTTARTLSMDGDLINNTSGLMWWVVKLEQSGTVEWTRTLGGLYGNSGLDVVLPSNGGYLLGGGLLGPGADAPCYHGTAQDAMEDAWVVKLSPSGALEWQRCLGGTGLDEYGWPGGAFASTNDGGCVIAALSHSSDGDVTDNHGNGDAWLAKVTAQGELLWQRALGGSGLDDPSSILVTSDGGFLLAGITTSSNGDVSGQHGGSDTWLLKLEGDGSGVYEVQGSDFTLSPVPATELITLTTSRQVQHARASLIDALGQVVMIRMLSGTVHRIDVGDLSRGVYMLTLQAAGASSSRRLVLE